MSFELRLKELYNYMCFQKKKKTKRKHPNTEYLPHFSNGRDKNYLIAEDKISKHVIFRKVLNIYPKSKSGFNVLGLLANTRNQN